MLYWVWSDLVTVAYYLQGVTLWQQSVTTAAGTVMESITLLNLLLAVVILIAMYALVRNIGGLLEVLVFSRVKLFPRHALYHYDLSHLFHYCDWRGRRLFDFRDVMVEITMVICCLVCGSRFWFARNLC